MELFDAIATRYSYRGQFTDAAVPRQHLEKIVQAGMQAPSACNRQMASFVIVDAPQLLAQIAELIGKPVCQSAKAMIVCVGDPSPVYNEWSFVKEDCAAAAENMLLAIAALGYASVWLDGALRTDDRAARIGRLLGIPIDRSVRILLPIGVPAEPGTQRERLPFEERAWFNRFGGGQMDR
jgi:nitroreductase